MKCGEVLNNNMSNIIRKYIDFMKLAAYRLFLYQILSCSFGSKFNHCICIYIVYVS